MKRYKHYSFDLWLTLIKSNPEFKRQRALYFHKKYNTSNKSLSEVEAVFKKIDNLCNVVNEKTGKNIDADEMYLMVIGHLNDFDAGFDDIDLIELYVEIEKIIFNYLPEVYCSKTIDTLQAIKQTTNASFNILSNTAFIKGSTLRIVLDTIGLSNFFDFQIYSDEVGFSKPNPAIFNLMIETISKNGVAMPLEDIVHVGDNSKADIAAAQKMGIGSFCINSNANRITNLLD